MLLKSDIFRALPETFVETVATYMSTCVISKGMDIVVKDDVAEEMFFIGRGKVDVIIMVDGEEVTVATLADGDCFGESALITNSLRSATVRAASDVELFVLKRSDFDYVISFSEELKTSMKTITIMRISPKARHTFSLMMQQMSGVPWVQSRGAIQDWRKNAIDAAEAELYSAYFGGAAEKAIVTNGGGGGGDKPGLSPVIRVGVKVMADISIAVNRLRGLPSIQASPIQASPNLSCGDEEPQEPPSLPDKVPSSSSSPNHRSLVLSPTISRAAPEANNMTTSSGAGGGITVEELTAAMQAVLAPLQEMTKTINELQQEQVGLRREVQQLTAAKKAGAFEM